MKICIISRLFRVLEMTTFFGKLAYLNVTPTAPSLTHRQTTLAFDLPDSPDL